MLLCLEDGTLVFFKPVASRHIDLRFKDGKLRRRTPRRKRVLDNMAAPVIERAVVSYHTIKPKGHAVTYIS